MKRSTALMVFIVFPIIMMGVLIYLMFAPTKESVKTESIGYAPTITMTEIADVENPVIEENDEYYISCKDGSTLKTDKIDTSIQYIDRMPSIHPYVLTDIDGDYTHYTAYLFKD